MSWEEECGYECGCECGCGCACVSMDGCVCVCEREWVCMCEHGWMCVCVSMDGCVCVWAWMWEGVIVCGCACVSMDGCVCVSMGGFACVCMSVSGCACSCECTCVGVYRRRGKPLSEFIKEDAKEEQKHSRWGKFFPLFFPSSHLDSFCFVILFRSIFWLRSFLINLPWSPFVFLSVCLFVNLFVRWSFTAEA